MIKKKAFSRKHNDNLGKAKSDNDILEANANKELLTHPYLQKIQAESMLPNSS